MGNRTDEEILRELNMRNISTYGAAIAYSAVVITAGILGNIVSFAFYRFNSRRTTTNVLMTWLAATDLVTCIVFIDVIIRLCFTVNFRNHTMCWLMFYFNHSLIIISACLFVIISVDRYRKICRPHHWQLATSKLKLPLVCVIIVALITSMSVFVYLDIVASNMTDPDTGRQIEAYFCTVSRDPDLRIFAMVSVFFYLSVFVALFLSPAVLYTIIVWNLWKHRQIKRKRNTAVLHIAKKRNSTTDFESHTKSNENKSCSEQEVVKDTFNGTKEKKKTEQPLGINHDKETDYVSSSSVEDDSILADGEICASGIGATETSLKDEQGKRNKVKMFTFAGKTQQRYSNLERNVTFMNIAFSVVTILSYLPYFIVILALPLSMYTSDQNDVGIMIASRSFLLNNASRPFIIGYFNTEFRRFVTNLFRKFLSCIYCFCFRR